MVLQWKAAVNPFLPVVIQHDWQTGLNEPMRIKEVKAQAVTTSKQGKQKVISNLILTALRTSLKSIYATTHLHRVGSVHWWFSGTGQVGWDSGEDINLPVSSFGLWKIDRHCMRCAVVWNINNNLLQKVLGEELQSQEGACFLRTYTHQKGARDCLIR